VGVSGRNVGIMKTRRIGGAALALGVALVGSGCSQPALPALAPLPPAPTVSSPPPPAHKDALYPVGLRILHLRRGPGRPLPTLLFYPAAARTPSIAPAGPVHAGPMPIPTPAQAAALAGGAAIEPTKEAPQVGATPSRAAQGRATHGNAAQGTGMLGAARQGGATQRIAAQGRAALGAAAQGGSAQGGASGNADGWPRVVLPTGIANPPHTAPAVAPHTAPAAALAARRSFPAVRAVRGRAPAVGRFPLVIYSHGLSGSPWRFASALAGWAASGFVVVAPIYPYTNIKTADYRPWDIVNQPDDARYVLKRIRALAVTPGDPLRGRIDVGRIAAVGHSAGGYTTTGLFVAGHDPRLRAGVVLAGWQAPGAFAGPAATMLFLQGTADPVVPMAKSHAAYARVPWPKRYIVLRGISHANYLLPHDLGYPLVAPVVLDFLRWTLQRDQAAGRRVPQREAGPVIR
jgi:dienelactone hydrolase